MYKNKFLIKKNPKIVANRQLSNFEYFKLYIYNLKYSKLDNCLFLLKNNDITSGNNNKIRLTYNNFVNSNDSMYCIKNLDSDLLLKLINFKLLNVIPLYVYKGITFNNLKLISFNNKSESKFLTYPTKSLVNYYFINNILVPDYIYHLITNINQYYLIILNVISLKLK